MKNLREELLSRDRGIFEDDNVSKEQIDKLLALFRQAIDEVIGEAEEEEFAEEDGGDCRGVYNILKNQFRTEQRERAKKLTQK